MLFLYMHVSTYCKTNNDNKTGDMGLIYRLCNSWSTLSSGLTAREPSGSPWRHNYEDTEKCILSILVYNLDLKTDNANIKYTQYLYTTVGWVFE